MITKIAIAEIAAAIIETSMIIFFRMLIIADGSIVPSKFYAKFRRAVEPEFASCGTLRWLNKFSKAFRVQQPLERVLEVSFEVAAEYGLLRHALKGLLNPLNRGRLICG